jgi:hypothetical protein
LRPVIERGVRQLLFSAFKGDCRFDEAGKLRRAASLYIHPAARLVVTKTKTTNTDTKEQIMRNVTSKLITRLFVLLAVATFAAQSARADESSRAPELPTPLCQSIQVPAGHEVAFHAYALGVQVYRWNGTSWAFVGPVANLYADAGFRGQVGTHYGGPTWESNSGSKVIAKRVDGTGCAPDANAIPWLLLEDVSTDGPGIFNSTTFIQRVNTTGGLAPTTPGSTIGEVKEVPYTAEYFFYRATN